MLLPTEDAAEEACIKPPTRPGSEPSFSKRESYFDRGYEFTQEQERKMVFWLA